MKKPVGGRKRSRAILAGFVAAAFVLAACGGGETADPGEAEPDVEAPDTDAEPSADPDGRTRLIVGIPGDWVSVDATVVGNGSNAVGLSSIYASLMERGIPWLTSGEVTPGIATSVTANDDATVWTIELRDDVYWHDGTQLTAEDVAFTINLISSPDMSHGVMHSHFRTAGEGAEVIDDFTVQVNMADADGMFRVNAPRMMLIPKHYYEEVGPEAFAEHPIGAGPYKFVEWRRDDQIVLEAHEQYWQGPPPIDEVIFRVIPDDAARVAALRAGEIDLMHPLPVDQISVIESDPELAYQSVPALGRLYIMIDTFREPFDQREVRLAINHAIDREGIVNEILDGHATILGGMIVPIEPGFNPDLEPFEYDPDLARQYLADAGYPNGLGDEFGEQEMMCREGSSAQLEDLCTLIATMLTEVGIPTAPRVVDNSSYAEISSEGNMTAFGLNSDGGGGSFFGHQILRVISACTDELGAQTPLRPSPNWGGYYCNHELDAKMWEVSQVVHNDIDRAVELLQEADAFHREDAGKGILWVANMIFGHRANLEFPAPARDDYQLYYARWIDNPRMAD